MRVEWDDAKDAVNQEKHGLSFAEARVLFDSGVDHLVIFDADHSQSEDRFLAIGPVGRGIVVIAFTEPTEDTIRIVSARWATTKERVPYRSYMDRNQ